MALYIDDIDLSKLKEHLASCRGLEGEDLKVCIYKVLSNVKVRDSVGLGYVELCREPFWMCMKLGDRRVYVVYNANLDLFYVVTSYLAKRVRSFIVAAEEAYRHLEGAPTRISIVIPKRKLSISLRSANRVNPVKAIANAISLASLLACF